MRLHHHGIRLRFCGSERVLILFKCFKMPKITFNVHIEPHHALVLHFCPEFERNAYFENFFVTAFGAGSPFDLLN